MHSVQNRHCLQFEKYAFIHRNVSPEISYSYPAKIHWHSNFNRDCKASLTKRYGERLMINALDETSAEFVVDLVKDLQC